MRFLGADPSGRPDDVEATLMLLLNNRIVSEMEKQASGG